MGEAMLEVDALRQQINAQQRATLGDIEEIRSLSAMIARQTNKIDALQLALGAAKAQAAKHQHDIAQLTGPGGLEWHRDEVNTLTAALQDERRQNQKLLDEYSALERLLNQTGRDNDVLRAWLQVVVPVALEGLGVKS